MNVFNNLFYMRLKCKFNCIFCVLQTNDINTEITTVTSVTNNLKSYLINVDTPYDNFASKSTPENQNSSVEINS